MYFVAGTAASEWKGLLKKYYTIFRSSKLVVQMATQTIVISLYFIIVIYVMKQIFYWSSDLG